VNGNGRGHSEAKRKKGAGDESLLDRALALALSAASLVVPRAVDDLAEEISSKLGRIPTELNEYGYDPWGFQPKSLESSLIFTALLYRYFFRVDLQGVENFPRGRMLLIANHAGQLPLDAAMLMCGAILEADPPRILRGMAEYWMPTLPFIGTMGVRSGSVVGTPKNCIDLLRRDEAVIAFPEGVHGLNKLFTQRYRLQKFGLGFMRLALETDTPIIPAAVVGSEEQAPAIANVKPLARLIRAPAFPITLTFPWLGLLGLLPLPVKYHIYLGEAMHFSGNPNDEDAIIERKVQQVKQEIRGMIERGLRARKSIFY
jgi:1-acyl-sn-glycerol-3-phosphate acyltransferase